MSDINNISEKLVNKIQSLFNMTVENGCTEEEAAAAAIMAQQLLLKHNLDHADILARKNDNNQPINDTTHEYVPSGLNKPQYFDWLFDLAAQVAEVCFCRALGHRRTLAFTFVGSPTDIKVAKQMFLFLLGQMERLCYAKAFDLPDVTGMAKDDLKSIMINGRELWVPKDMKTHKNALYNRGIGIQSGKGTTRSTWYHSYFVGCSQRVCELLREDFRNEQKQEKVTALVVCKDALVQSYIDDKWKKFAKPQQSTARVRNDAYMDGYMDGAKVRTKLQKQIGG